MRCMGHSGGLPGFSGDEIGQNSHRYRPASAAFNGPSCAARHGAQNNAGTLPVIQRIRPPVPQALIVKHAVPRHHAGDLMARADIRCHPRERRNHAGVDVYHVESR